MTAEISTADEVVTYDDLLSFQDLALAAMAKDATAKPQGNGVTIVAIHKRKAKPRLTVRPFMVRRLCKSIGKVARFVVTAKPTKGGYDPLTNSVARPMVPAKCTTAKPTKAERDAEAAYAMTLVGQFPAKPVAMTADRAGMHLASIKLAQKGHWSFRRGGLSPMALARKELGLGKKAGHNEVVAALKGCL